MKLSEILQIILYKKMNFLPYSHKQNQKAEKTKISLISNSQSQISTKIKKCPKRKKKRKKKKKMGKN